MTELGCLQQVWSDRWASVAQAFREQRWLFGLLYAILTVLATPIGLPFAFILERFGRNLDERRGRGRKQSLVDAWHISFLIVTLVTLFFRAPSWLLLSIPTLKLLDLFQTMLSLTMNPSRGSRGSARPLVHLLVHYLQVVVAFASYYLFLCCSCDCLFRLNGSLGKLGPGDAFYLSLVTAATVGFGDITPRLPADGSTGWHCYPIVLVQLEIIMAVALTVLFVPYFLALASSSEISKK